jgi:hypothetical protein
MNSSVSLRWRGVLIGAGILTLAASGLCWGDGGALLLREQVGGRIFSIFTSPAEITVGPVEVTVLIEGATGRPMVGEPVEVAVIDGWGAVVSKAAGWGDLGNGALAGTRLALPHAGEWTLRVRTGGGEASKKIRVSEARGRLLAHWRAWLFVPVLLALFLWHQWLTLGATNARRVGRA